MNNLFWRVILFCIAPINGISKLTKLLFAGKKQIIISYLLSIILFPAVSAQAEPASASRVPKTAAVAKKTDWQEEWKKAVAEAKLEGKVSIASSAGSNLMHSLGTEFKKKYGIEVEYVSAISSELLAKTSAEQSAGLYLRDIVMGGVTTLLLQIPILSPVEASLILPEVKDINVWLDHKLPFFDEEGKIFLYLARVGPTLLVNKEIVKAEEIKSWLHLRGPKWQGKILFFEPR